MLKINNVLENKLRAALERRSQPVEAREPGGRAPRARRFLLFFNESYAFWAYFDLNFFLIVRLLG